MDTATTGSCSSTRSRGSRSATDAADPEQVGRSRKAPADRLPVALPRVRNAPPLLSVLVAFPDQHPTSAGGIVRSGIPPRLGVLALGLALTAGPVAGCTGSSAGGQAAGAPGRYAASSPAVGPSAPAPDGRIDRGTLLNTRLNLPAWPALATRCADRNVALTSGP